MSTHSPWMAGDFITDVLLNIPPRIPSVPWLSHGSTSWFNSAWVQPKSGSTMVESNPTNPYKSMISMPELGISPSHGSQPWNALPAAVPPGAHTKLKPPISVLKVTGRCLKGEDFSRPEILRGPALTLSYSLWQRR